MVRNHIAAAVLVLCVFGMLAALRASVSFMPSDCHARDGYNHKQEFLCLSVDIGNISGIFPCLFHAWRVCRVYERFTGIWRIYSKEISKTDRGDSVRHISDPVPCVFYSAEYAYPFLLCLKETGMISNGERILAFSVFFWPVILTIIYLCSTFYT